MKVIRHILKINEETEAEKYTTVIAEDGNVILELENKHYRLASDLNYDVYTSQSQTLISLLLTLK